MRFKKIYDTYDKFETAMNRYGEYKEFEKLYNLISDKYYNYDLRWDIPSAVNSNVAIIFDDIYRTWKIWTELKSLNINKLTMSQINDTMTAYRLDNDTDDEYKEFGNSKMTSNRETLNNPVDLYRNLLKSYRNTLIQSINKMTTLFVPFYNGYEIDCLGE